MGRHGPLGPGWEVILSILPHLTNYELSKLQARLTVLRKTRRAYWATGRYPPKEPDDFDPHLVRAPPEPGKPGKGGGK